MLWRPLGASGAAVAAMPALVPKFDERFSSSPIIFISSTPAGSHRRAGAAALAMAALEAAGGLCHGLVGSETQIELRERLFAVIELFLFADLRALTGQCRKFRKEAAQRMDHAGQPFAGAPPGCPRR